MTTSEIARVALLAGHIRPKLTKAEKRWNALRCEEIELLRIVRTSSGRRLAKFAKKLIEIQNKIYPSRQLPE